MADAPTRQSVVLADVVVGRLAERYRRVGG
jgi:hypothetical protein